MRNIITRRQKLTLDVGKKPGPTLLMLLDAVSWSEIIKAAGQRLFAELLRRYVLREGFEAYVVEQEELGYIRSQGSQSRVPAFDSGT